MPSAKPLKLYLEALENYNQGNRETAAQKLAEAFGAKEPSPVITNSLDKFLDYGSRPNDAVLQIIATEVSKSGGNND
ncbi:MAG TPA: hypothetical protein VMW64_04310 [Dehalococcoidia bacterium]|nr:hypothetical protein [Dehalococcoidia bacterium]